MFMHTLKRIGQCIGAILVTFSAGAIGSLATVPNIPTWYAQLNKPSFLPPNEVFGPTWSVLYVAIGVSLFLVWITKGDKSFIKTYLPFYIQLALNAIWSIVFFGLHLPWLGCVVIISLVATIIWTILVFKNYSKVSAWILVPYLAWVLFATYLTFGVAILN